MLCTKLFLKCCQWKFHLVLTNFQFCSDRFIRGQVIKRPYFCNIFQFYLLTNIYISLCSACEQIGLKIFTNSKNCSHLPGIIFTLTSFFWTFCTDFEKIINFCEKMLYVFPLPARNKWVLSKLWLLFQNIDWSFWSRRKLPLTFNFPVKIAFWGFIWPEAC